jgi:Activator of Hsp90 ATPase homolog 1-like protein
MKNENFRYSFTTSKKPTEVFAHLLNPKNWWVGIFGETIEGNSNDIGDEFSFSAGGGAHYSNQKLAELLVDKKIVWLVTESNLSFLDNTNEWAGTKIGFDIEPENNTTRITFTHEGLQPSVECYSQCSNGWIQYLHRLQEHLT